MTPVRSKFDHRRNEQIIIVNSPLHLQRADDTGQDAAANADVTGPGALLVNVRALDGLEGEERCVSGMKKRKIKRKRID